MKMRAFRWLGESERGGLRRRWGGLVRAAVGRGAPSVRLVFWGGGRGRHHLSPGLLAPKPLLTSCYHPPSCPGARCLPLGLAPVGYSLPRGERGTGKGGEPQGGWSSWTLLHPSALAPRGSLAEPAGLPSAGSWGGTPPPPPKSRQSPVVAAGPGAAEVG